MKGQQKESWNAYCVEELKVISRLLYNHGFELDEKQIHIAGERHLFSGKKFVLTGTEMDTGKKVIIKASNDPQGKKEILHQRLCKQTLNQIEYAKNIFNSPEEILYFEKEPYIISIVTHIEQDITFLERTTEQQFFLSLKAFELQEGVHATTSKHMKVMKKIFGTKNASDYLKTFDEYKQIILISNEDTELTSLLSETSTLLTQAATTIELYGNFLVHTDFVPHNIRVKDNTIYFLDHSAIRFGNKHEGWARFLNFMTLYNRDLEKALLFYFKNNRSKEENESLRLMRIYRLVELIAHYSELLELTNDNLHTLTKGRVVFWTQVLKATLINTQVNESIVEEYKKTRDSLRSTEEKTRQKNLH